MPLSSLETWDGLEREEISEPGGAVRTSSVRLTATLRTFPKTVVEFSLAVPAPSTEHESTLLADSPDGETPIRVLTSPGGMSHLANPSDVDPDSLLVDEIMLRDPSTGRLYSRVPRSAVVLRDDPLQGCYVEADRIQLGEKSALLVAASLVDRAREVLKASARPGYRELPPGTPGMPAGWVMVRDIDVLTRFEGTLHADLTVLQPLAGASLSVSGGFQMPGHLRKWSSLEPPEIQAIGESAEQARVRIDRGDKIGEPVFDETFNSSVALVPLSQHPLADGEYLVTLFADGASRPVATSVLRLRSSDSLTADGMKELGGLGHRPAAQGPSWVLTAVAVDGDALHWTSNTAELRGLNISAELAAAVDEPLLPPRSSVATPTDLDPRRNALVRSHGMPPAKTRPRPVVPNVERRPLRLGRGLGDASCMKTLAHRFELPDARPDVPKSAFIESACVKCGLEKRFPTRGRQKKAASTRGRAMRAIESLPPAEAIDGEALPHRLPSTPCATSAVARSPLSRESRPRSTRLPCTVTASCARSRCLGISRLREHLTVVRSDGP